LPKKKDPAAVKLGRKGGKEIAKQGSEYFSQLQEIKPIPLPSRTN
jgi:hypothetical protein